MILNKKLQDKLSTQFVILTVIEKRFSILKFLYSEYQNNNKGIFNKFIIETMHVYRKSVVIDLCKLYITPNPKSNDKFKGNSQNNNFYYTINTHRKDLEEYFEVVDRILSSLEFEIKLITNERDKELAHKDSSTGTSIKMRLKNMDEIEKLVCKAREIIEILYRVRNGAIEKEDFQNRTLKKIIEYLKEEK